MYHCLLSIVFLSSYINIGTEWNDIWHQYNWRFCFFFIHKYVVLILISISISKLLSESLAPTSRFVPSQERNLRVMLIYSAIYAKCYFHSQNQPPKKYKFQSINHEMINSELTSNVVNKTSFIINQKYSKNNCTLQT